MREICDLIRQIHYLRFQAWISARIELARSGTILEMRMLDDSLAHLETQIESAKIRIANLDPIDGAQALRVVIEAAVRRHQLVEHFLARVTEGRVPQVVRQCDRLCKLLIDAKR